MDTLQIFKDYYKAHKDEILADYFTFLRFRTIATDPSYKPEVLACANWLEDYMKKIGLNVERWEETSGSPTLFATFGKGKKTLLLYCHYDVQPVDPLDLWITSPFEPTVRDGNVYARGAVDDKGQAFYTIWAIKAMIEKCGSLDINLKLLIEGEEESGSQTLHTQLLKKKQALKADYVLIVDSGLQDKNKPAISLGVRGLVCLSLTLQETNFDLHSGTHGGIVYNPNRAMVELLASFHDENGKVNIPSFYDDIVEMTKEEKSEFNFEFDHAHFSSHFRGKAHGMEEGYSPHESAWVRPTFEINGISGGYAGPGFKTVIPAKTTAKISCRLVPNQNPEKIIEMVKKALLERVPKGLELKIEVLPGLGRAFRTSPHSSLAKTMVEAYTQVFEKPCDHLLMGGSIPIASDLAETAGGEMVFIGVGLAEDQIHAPNEHFGLDRFEQGFLIMCQTLQLVAKN